VTLGGRMTVDDGKVGADNSVAKKRVGVLVVAYNAATTLAKVLDRIPADRSHFRRSSARCCTTKPMRFSAPAP
jgi:hypothetical protein